MTADTMPAGTIYRDADGRRYRHLEDGRLDYLDPPGRVASPIPWPDEPDDGPGDEHGEEEPADRDDGDPVVDLHLAKLRSRLLSVDDLAALPPPEPLIDDLLMRGGLGVLWGKPGSGKSFIALDWALSVGVGAWWLGREVSQGFVLYLAAEGAPGLNERVRAWQSEHTICKVRSDQFGLLPGTVNLFDQQWAEAAVRLAVELRPVLVVADTLARTMVGGDENTSRDMGVVVSVANRVQEVSGAAVLFVHHDTKEGSTMRGSSALFGAVDTSIECKADGQAVTLKCEKQKDARAFEPIRLWREEVGSSCVIRSQTAVRQPGDFTASQEKLRRVAWDSCGTDGLVPRDLMEVSGLAKATFYRSLKDLVGAGELVNVGTEKRPRFRPPAPVAS